MLITKKKYRNPKKYDGLSSIRVCVQLAFPVFDEHVRNGFHYGWAHSYPYQKQEREEALQHTLDKAVAMQILLKT